MTLLPRSLFLPILFGLAASLGFAREARAQATFTDERGALTLSAKIEAADTKASPDAPAAVHRGRTFRLLVSGKVKEGNHIYAFTKVPDQTDPSFTSRIRFKVPAGVEVLWPGKEKEPVLKSPDSYYEHEGEFYYAQDLLVLPDAKEGSQPLELQVSVQVCNDNSCRPIKTILTLNLPISNKAPEVVSPELEKRRTVPMPDVQKRAGWSVELHSSKPADQPGE